MGETRITGGRYKGLKLKTADFLRPTMAFVRQALFNVVDVGGKSFLDLFCGSCVVSAEAISRGAREVVAVDNSKRAVRLCDENLRKLSEGIYRILHMDCVDYLESVERTFDVIFMDPPYASTNLAEQVLRLLPRAMEKGSLAILEKSKRERLVVPDELEVVEVKEYGETQLVFLRVKGWR